MIECNSCGAMWPDDPDVLDDLDFEPPCYCDISPGNENDDDEGG